MTFVVGHDISPDRTERNKTIMAEDIPVPGGLGRRIRHRDGQDVVPTVDSRFL